MAITARLSQRRQEDTGVTETLTKISETRANLIALREVKKSPPIATASPNDFPFEIPSHWKWVKLGELAKVIEYGTSQKAHQHPTGIPVLRMGNITDGCIDYSHLKYVADNIKDLPKLYLKKNDLVFNRTNSFELVGKMGIFEEDDDIYTLASYLIRVTLFANEVNPHYINAYFQSSICRTTQIEPNITIQTNQTNFNGTKLRNVLIPLPPYEEQARIVTQVRQLMGILDNLNESLSAANEIGGQFAAEIVAAVTGTKIKEEEKMKAPKMELVSKLKAGDSPGQKEQAPLTSLLTRNKGELSAKALWSYSGLKIDEFYRQLRTEMTKGWIVEPEKAFMKEVAAS